MLRESVPSAFRGKYVGMRQDEARHVLFFGWSFPLPSSSILWIALDLDHSRFLERSAAQRCSLYIIVVNRSDTIISHDIPIDVPITVLYISYPVIVVCIPTISQEGYIVGCWPNIIWYCCFYSHSHNIHMILWIEEIHQLVDGFFPLPHLLTLNTLCKINIDPEHHQFLMETRLPTPTTARVYVNLPEGR